MNSPGCSEAIPGYRTAKNYRAPMGPNGVPIVVSPGHWAPPEPELSPHPYPGFAPGAIRVLPLRGRIILKQA